MGNAESPRIDTVDALRGWAILGVIACHTSTYVPLANSALEQLAQQGARGVQLFFLVSAFTLFGSLVQRSGESDALRSYFIRRFFRIAPMYYCAMAFWLLVQGTGPNGFAPNGYGMPTIVSTALFTNDWHPLTANAIIPGAWSIAVEANFYLILPLLFAYVDSLGKAIAVGAILSVVGIALGRLGAKAAPMIFSITTPQEGSLAASLFLDFGVTIALPAFMAGMLLHFVWPRFKLKPWIARAAIALSLILFVKLTYTSTSKNLVMILPLAIFAIALLSHAAMPFVNRLTIYIGQRSYSAFFVHNALLYTIPFALYPQIVDYPIALAITILLTFVGSEITYRLVEQQGQEVGRVVISWFRQNQKQHGSPRLVSN